MGPDLLVERNRPSGHVRERDDFLSPAKISSVRHDNDRGSPDGLNGAWRDKSPRVWFCISHPWMPWSPCGAQVNEVNQDPQLQIFGIFVTPQGDLSGILESPAGNGYFAPAQEPKPRSQREQNSPQGWQNILYAG
jgi:hypothetical protein